MKKIFSLFIFLVTFVVFNSTANAGTTTLCTYKGLVYDAFGSSRYDEARIELRDRNIYLVFNTSPNLPIPSYNVDVWNYTASYDWEYKLQSSGDSAIRDGQDALLNFNGEKSIDVTWGSSNDKNNLVDKGFCPSSITFGLKDSVENFFDDQYGRETAYEIFAGSPQTPAYDNADDASFGARYFNYTTSEFVFLSQDLVDRVTGDMNECVTDVDELLFLTGLFNFSLENFSDSGNKDKDKMADFYENIGFDSVANLIIQNYSSTGECYQANPNLSSYYDSLVGAAQNFLSMIGQEQEQGEEVNSCDEIVGDGTFKYYVNNTFKFIQYIGPVIAIILSSIEYMKAAALADSGALKSANKKTIIRIIFTLLLFLIPVVVNILLDIFGFYEHCDISHF